MNQFVNGDLVLAKVQGFPFWPAKVSMPEEHERTPDPGKYFVKFFGTGEIAFVGPADIQAFTSEKKIELSQGLSKPYREAVKEICEVFEKLQDKDFSSIRNDGALIDEPLEVSGSDGTNKEGPKCKSKIIPDLNAPSAEMSSLLEGSPKQGGKERQDIKSSLNVMYNMSPIHTEEERSCDITVGGKYPNGGQSKFINGHYSTVNMEIAKKFNGAGSRNSGSDFYRGGIMQRNFLLGGNKVSSFEKNDKILLKDRKHSEENYDDHCDILSLKKVKVIRNRETAEASSPAKMPKRADAQDTGMVKAHLNMKKNCKDSKVVGDKIKYKTLALGAKQVPTKRRAVLLCDEDEDDLPETPIHGGFTNKVSAIPHVSDSNNKPVKHGENDGLSKLVSRNMVGAIQSLKEVAKPAQVLETVSSPLVSENKLGNSLLRKNGLVLANKFRSPDKRLPTKRRAVLLCDVGASNELPKTPIHGGSTSKVSDIPHVSGSKGKLVKHVGNYGISKLVSRNFSAIDRLKEEATPALLSNRSLLGSEKLSSQVPKPVLVSSKKSPHSSTYTKPLAEPQNKQPPKVHDNISQKKAPVGTNRGLSLTESNEISSLNRLINERSKPVSSGGKGKSTPSSDSLINDSVLVVRNPSESVGSVDERFHIGEEIKKISVSKTPDPAIPMKNLIAAAQERKRRAQNENFLSTFIHDADVAVRSTSPAPAVIAVELTSMPQLDVQGLHVSSINRHESEELEERRVSSGRQTTLSSLSEGIEAAASHNTLEGMLETLSRTKDSIGRATLVAIDCAKYGFATEVVELLVKKLENEPTLHRRVDFFFLVDSITQYSYNQKGVAGASYIPIIQSALPRLLGAAAPPGTAARENRRQCHKVLRLWLERNILPESVLRRHMDEIRVENDDNSAGFLLRRFSRYERGIDDPIREMEGMFVDEYGSNVTFLVPGLLPCHAFYDEEDEDDFPTNFDKVKDISPPIHTSAACTDPERDHVTQSDRRLFILEDVDGELERQDISEQQKGYNVISTNDTIQSEQSPDRTKKQYQIGSDMNDELLASPSSPPLPDGTPPPTPPLPTSPPPSSSQSQPPPPSLLLQQHLFPHQLYPAPPTSYSIPPPPYAAHVPPLVSQQHQPAFMSQHRLPPPSLVSLYAQRPLRPECLPQFPPSQFSYANSVHQYQQPPPYSFPNLSRNATDYFGPPTERHPPSVVTFQPSGPNALPAVTPIPVRGMMPSRLDMSTVRPA